MVNDNISGSNPHFHQGERQVQQRVGVQDTANLGRRNIHDHMPRQHREFYQQQALIFIAAQDKQNRPWPSVIVGQEGLINTPSEHEMVISGRPFSEEPIQEGLTEAAPVGLLGLDFGSRRRNRMNGRIKGVNALTPSSAPLSMTVSVDQAFGNCPKYIQSRAVLQDGHGIEGHVVTPQVQRSHEFSDEQRRLVEKADTFFIATQHQMDQAPHQTDKAAPFSLDMSHRGGKPGFIKFVDDNTLQWPDFMGNFYFNTLGNLETDARAGLLFLDFETGSLLSVTGHAQVIWNGADLEDYEGAERLVKFSLDEVVYIPNAYPLKWSTVKPSPFLAQTDSWVELEARREAEQKRNHYQTYRVTKVQDEAEDIRSFYLQAEGSAVKTLDSKNVHARLPFKPGQFLPIKITDANGKPQFRTYSLSGSPHHKQYRISVKRLSGENPGLVSNLLHERLQPGTLLEAMPPQGDFVLSENQRPVVLLSAGVGITPMVSMLQSIIEENARTGKNRLVYFIHGTQNRQYHGFREQVDLMAKTTPWLKVVYCYSQATTEEEKLDQQKEGPIHYFSGRINKQVLQQTLPIDDYEFYLCGPGGFMQSSYQLLKALNVNKESIHYEFFGPSTLMDDGSLIDNTGAQQTDTKRAEMPVVVKFARSQKAAIWQPESGSLLELAESQGINPAYGCRNGQCNTCITKVQQGKVHQSTNVSSLTGENILICCATPASEHDVEFENQPLVLDL